MKKQKISSFAEELVSLDEDKIEESSKKWNREAIDIESFDKSQSISFQWIDIDVYTDKPLQQHPSGKILFPLLIFR